MTASYYLLLPPSPKPQPPLTWITNLRTGLPVTILASTVDSKCSTKTKPLKILSQIL